MFEKGALNGQTALVTGGGRGIGRAIALGYAKAGARVCVTSRTVAELDETVKEIKAGGGDAAGFPCDVASLESVESMYTQAADFLGTIDILVINAGINPEKAKVEDSSPDRWKATIDINLIGAYYCARSVIPYMKNTGSGKIITIGSGKGHRGSSRGSAYACSKAGLWMLTTVLAEELAEYNISVNELVPGPVLTKMNTSFGEKIDSVFTSGEEWVKRPEDIVPLAVFMASQPPGGPSHQSFSLARRRL